MHVIACRKIRARRYDWVRRHLAAAIMLVVWNTPDDSAWGQPMYLDAQNQSEHVIAETPIFATSYTICS